MSGESLMHGKTDYVMDAAWSSEEMSVWKNNEVPVSELLRDLCDCVAQFDRGYITSH